MNAPVDYCNGIARVSSMDNFISINGAADVDLYGQISSESSGLRHISGAGGQQDFVMGAYLSKGGKSFICCSATVIDKRILYRKALLKGECLMAAKETNMR